MPQGNYNSGGEKAGLGKIYMYKYEEKLLVEKAKKIRYYSLSHAAVLLFLAYLPLTLRVPHHSHEFYE